MRIYNKIKIKETNEVQRGQIFRHTETADVYIVAYVGADGYVLTSLNDGNLWTDVNKDINMIFGRARHEFAQVNEEFSVTPTTSL